MPNSYTTVPSIIPGNLTVQGNMAASGSVSGSSIVGTASVTVGSGRTTTHLATSGTNYGGVFVNVAQDGVTRDNTLFPAWMYTYDPTNSKLSMRMINAAGSAMDVAPRLTVAALGSQITTTGIVASIAQYGATLRANVMGAHGGLRMRAVFTVNALVSASIPLNIQLGGVTIVSVALNATGLWAIEALVLNQALTNSQRGVLWVYRNGVAPALSVGTSAVDTTADQAFQAVAVMGNVGDSITANHGETEFLNTFGPV